MRTVWPMLWLLPTMAGTAAIAWRIAGREAALIALLLALVGLPAFHQFRPGRIDHHNVQIALSVLVVAATVWSDRVRWAAAAAGALTGLALAIGLECLPYLVACAAAFAARYAARSCAVHGRPPTTAWRSPSSTLVGFLVIVEPGHWGRGVCDAIALNWLALVLAGRARPRARRHAVRDNPAAGTLCARPARPARLPPALFVWIEPRCLGVPTP